MSEATILSETAYVDTTQPPGQQKRINVIFMLPTGIVGNISLPQEGYNTEKRNAAVREAAKKLMAKPFEKVKLT
jgi:hypothetical protein